MPNQFTPKRQAIIPVGPSIAYVPLTRGQFARIDSHRAVELCQWNWHAKWCPDENCYYARRTLKNQRPSKISMHAQILGISGRVTTGDHINRDTLNNQDYNLRPANQTQQILNQRTRIDNACGYRGVWWSVERNKWRSEFTIYGQRTIMPDAKTLEEAVLARERAMALVIPPDPPQG